jgi:hypothetical protein
MDDFTHLVLALAKLITALAVLIKVFGRSRNKK